MHTLPVLQKFFSDSLPQVHDYRLNAITVAVDAVLQGARVAVTSMGRSLAGNTRIKHRVKRMDRLVGNRLLSAERDRFYQLMTKRLLMGCRQPIILIDWSDFSKDRQQQLLRASMPVGGRAMTLLEQLHPYDKLANRTIQYRFLDQLKAMLPAGCIPIIIADAGFRTPFFRYVQALGWHWLGRIRHQSLVTWEGAPCEWIPAKSLHALATTSAQDLGQAQWVRSTPLEGRLVLVRQPKAHRQDTTLNGVPRRSKLSRQHAKRAREPWLLIASSSLQPYQAKQIVKLYKTRMQIEEGFRDTKSIAYGLGIARGRHTSFTRAANLLLIAALAMFSLWLIGCMAKARKWDRLVRVNSSSRTEDYSTIFLARLVIQLTNKRLPRDCLMHAAKITRLYCQSVFSP